MKIVSKLLALLLIATLLPAQTIQVGGGITVGGTLVATSSNVPLPPCTITTNSLATGTVSLPYSQTITTSNCTAPLTFSILSGVFPNGLSINAATGQITGSPSVASTFNFVAKVVDSHGSPQTATQALSITILNGTTSIISNVSCGNTGGLMDGPAQLPLTYLCSSEANTPRSGSVVSLGIGGNLQNTYNAAACGTDIQLAPGGTYTISTVAAKSCSGSQWIFIRTAPSGNLPAEGVTTTPCFSNVATLLDYNFPCSSPGAFTSKINVSPATTINNSADHIRWENLEIAKVAGGLLDSPFTMAGASNQVFDRVWIHGNAHEELHHAFNLTNSSSISIVDSYITDVHCISVSGSCTQANAIFATFGTGPYKISHTFVSAAGQHIIFGGGGGSGSTPSDIEITYNTFFKPLQWNPGCAAPSPCPGGFTYDGGTSGHAYDVQNTVELKNAQRAWLQGNQHINNWSGFSQVGNGFTITPKSQAPNGCPACIVTDVTQRYDTIANVAQPWQIFNGSTSAGWAAGGHNYSIHDVVASPVGLYPGCSGGCTVYLIELITGSSAPTVNMMHDVLMQHLTITLTGNAKGGEAMFALGGPVITPPGLFNYTLQNSIVPAGAFGIGGSGGGTSNCATPNTGIAKFTACWQPFTITNNCVPWGTVGLNLGAGQILLADQNAVQFTDLTNGVLTLQNTSPCHNVGTDGRDVGADILTVNNQTANAPPH